MAFSTAVMATALLHLVGLYRNAGGCESRYPAGEFLAYCDNDRFSDYEHGALYWELEPGLAEAWKRSSVLLLGNSRMQLGVSRQALSRLHDAGLEPYMLGFGFSEQFEFPLALIERKQIHVKAVIINADPFFAAGLSAPAAAVLGKASGEVLPGYWYRRLLQRTRAALCTGEGVLARSSACAAGKLSILRETTTGHWRLGSVPAGERAFQAGDRAGATMLDHDSLGQNARRMIERLGVPPRCVFITTVPSPMSTDRVARSVAQSLQANFVAGEAGGLRTFDDSHLTPESAERWSHSLLESLLPQLRACVT